MKDWDTIRTAYEVARLGTVSAAADVLAVHHATVIRQIDALEQDLGVKLFQRHARGYTPTEAGQELLRVAGGVSEDFARLRNAISGQTGAVSGLLRVTTVEALTSQLTTLIGRYIEAYPDVRVELSTSSRLYRMETGEAQVAIRAGAPPTEDDYVVRKLGQIPIVLTASERYIEAHGRPESLEALARHWFVAFTEGGARPPTERWLRENVPADRVLLQADSQLAYAQAVRAGIGVGFLPEWECEEDRGLVRLHEALPEWAGGLWSVTHVDLHRSPKVQAFLALLRDSLEDWGLLGG